MAFVPATIFGCLVEDLRFVVVFGGFVGLLGWLVLVDLDTEKEKVVLNLLGNMFLKNVL